MHDQMHLMRKSFQLQHIRMERRGLQQLLSPTAHNFIIQHVLYFHRSYIQITCEAIKD